MALTSEITCNYQCDSQRQFSETNLRTNNSTPQ